MRATHAERCGVLVWERSAGRGRVEGAGETERQRLYARETLRLRGGVGKIAKSKYRRAEREPMNSQHKWVFLSSRPPRRHMEWVFLSGGACPSCRTDLGLS